MSSCVYVELQEPKLQAIVLLSKTNNAHARED